jgi:regulation of enolase protein 1 (concanavalin A-like superfamily)
VVNAVEEKNMLRICALLFVAATCLGLKDAPDKDPPPTTLKGWGEVADPDGDCHVELDSGKVSMKVPASPHDFAAELERTNAPRVMSKVRGNFIVEVKISGSFAPAEPSTIPGRTPYNGAGMLIVVDDNNHLSLQRAALMRDGNVRHYANFELRKEGEQSASHYETDLDDGDVYLRLERRGKKVYAMFSPDGVKWKSYEPIDVKFPREVSVGVEAVNSSNDPFECSFANYAIYHKAAVATQPSK